MRLDDAPLTRRALYTTQFNGAEMKRIGFFFAVLLAVYGMTGAQSQQAAQHWVGTWAASPMENAVNPGQPSPANSTYRNIVRISAGGASIRVVLTNEFGRMPLTIGASHVALNGGNGSIEPGSDRALTFSGSPSVIIPASASVVSDPVAMPVSPLASLAVSVYLPQQRIDDTSCHDLAMSTNYIAPGDETAAATLNDARTIESWCFVKSIEVNADSSQAAAIVTLGDSITDGAKSTMNANRRWPDVLAERLQADKRTAHLSVLNEGISGNRLLHDRAGPNALSRFDRDVLGQDGVKYLIVLEGINDIGSVAQPHERWDLISTPDILFALTQIVTRAHEHGIKVFGATLTPYQGAGYYSDVGEKMRQDVNQWIRTNGIFDGVIDFDQITRDPARPSVFSAQADSGDHLHPGDEGYKEMGSAIDLSLFR
jgi:lysophospholipase L1-like esterase